MHGKGIRIKRRQRKAGDLGLPRNGGAGVRGMDFPRPVRSAATVWRCMGEWHLGMGASPYLRTHTQSSKARSVRQALFMASRDLWSPGSQPPKCPKALVPYHGCKPRHSLRLNDELYLSKPRLSAGQLDVQARSTNSLQRTPYILLGSSRYLIGPASPAQRKR